MGGERWPLRPFGELIESHDSARVPIKESERRSGPYPYYGASGVIDYIDGYLFDGEYLLVAEDGENLRTQQTPVAFMARGRFWVNNHAHVVRANAENVTRYLMYAMRGADLRSYLTGSTMPKLTQANLSRVPVLAPPKGVQEAIAHILGSLDDKIDLLCRMNRTLEDTCRALFRSWFVNFDPVRAKAAGRKPNGIDAETAKLFPKELVKSEFGEIPKGWTRAPLGEWATALSGGTPSKSDAILWGNEIPWISPKVMTAIHADEADAYVTSAAIGNGTRLAPAGSTLVMVRGMGLHQEVRVSQARRAVTFNQDVKALVPRGIQASLLLFALLDAQQYLLGKVESSGHGTGRLPSDVLLALPVTMPPVEVQGLLASNFDVFNARIASAREESRTLAAFRDTLLPKLLSGGLRIPDPERFLKEAGV